MDSTTLFADFINLKLNSSQHNKSIRVSYLNIKQL